MKEMQITLNQAEIETAIAEYLAERLEIQPGFKSVVDIKASRGPEGFTATIDLVPETEVKAEPEKPARQPRKAAEPKPVVVEAAPVVVEGKQEPETATATETAQEAADEPAGTEATDAPADAGAVEQAADVAETGQPETTDAAADSEAETAVPEKPRSLFSNLAKPKN